MKREGRTGRSGPEWLTIALIGACSTSWIAGIWLIGRIETWFLLPVLALPVALHSSLQHEIIHGHPTRWRWLNELLVAPAIGLFLPFRRFRRLHLRHHRSRDLTDPVFDPETPYLTASRWTALPRWRRLVLNANNTLAGRLVIGPVINTAGLIGGDIRSASRGDRSVIADWLWHLPALLPVLAWLWICGVPLWAYALLAAWPGMSILMLRTFAEHRWDADRRARTAIVERGGVFSLLFLNNNLHSAHHRWPSAPWYRLPNLHQKLWMEGTPTGDVFAGYGEIVRRYLFTMRETVTDPGRRNS
ncbi:MAG: fatty acid desaturase [Minwuia sp.]|uniref:fatty acid desaturase n=1 Tax=Minwuia sp. TaxID=2493630 RepID=UPI003A8AAB73